MSDRLRNNGFSLTEVMMAAGILAIGFAFIAGMFPVGVKLTALATEQTIAPIVADEAIAKIKLYGDPNFVEALGQAQLSSQSAYIDFDDLMLRRGFVIDEDEFAYPSTDITPELKKYNWSALCRRLGPRDVHVIVFVSRRAGAGARYLTHVSDYTSLNDDYGQAVLNPDADDWPVPVRVQIEKLGAGRLRIVDNLNWLDEEDFINAGSTIADDATGWVYRVLYRDHNIPDEIVLDREWEGQLSGFVWVVPPAITSSGLTVRVGGRYPCVRVDPTNTIHF